MRSITSAVAQTSSRLPLHTAQSLPAELQKVRKSPTKSTRRWWRCEKQGKGLQSFCVYQTRRGDPKGLENLSALSFRLRT